MPETFPDLPDQQFEVAAISRAAAAVGGDFYDYFEFNNGTTGFALGDISGKGIPAALYMARMVSDFRLYTQLHYTPTRVFGVLNDALAERSQRGMFVTTIYGVLNTTTGDFLFANAGHLPLIKMNGTDGSVELLENGAGVPLGIVKGYQFEQATVQLKPGDAIVLISDGVIEAKNKSREEYSLDRVVKLLAKQKSTAQETLDLLLQDVQRFSRGTVQHDDLTILVIKRR